MAWQRVSVDEDCKDGLTCPSVWTDDLADPDFVVVVGQAVEPSPVPVSAGEVAVRLRRQVIRDAQMQGL